MRAVAAQGGEVMAPALELGRGEQLGGALVVDQVPLEVEEQQRRLQLRRALLDALHQRPRLGRPGVDREAERGVAAGAPDEVGDLLQLAHRRGDGGGVELGDLAAVPVCEGLGAPLGVVEASGDTLGALATDQRLEVPARIGERLVGGRRRSGGCLGMHAEEATQRRDRATAASASRSRSASSDPTPSSQKAAAESTLPTIHSKFIPKNPVMKVSGRKIVATIVSR